MHVENRNSVDKRERRVWEMLSDKFNDPSFTPVTEELPTLHSDFIFSEELGRVLVKELAAATAEKCQRSCINDCTNESLYCKMGKKRTGDRVRVEKSHVMILILKDRKIMEKIAIAI